MPAAALRACGPGLHRGRRRGLRGGSDGPSKKDYEGTINSFCTDVKAAAGKVSADSAKLQSSAAKNPQQAVRGFGTTLELRRLDAERGGQAAQG